jgi:AGCS family alanine or glycine:cation symporter
MSAKFAECTLGQIYRVVRPDGHVSGGPMHYLGAGLARLGWPRLGTALAVVFSFMCIGGAFGGGNMFQANQAYAQVASAIPLLDGRAGAIGFGLALALAVGLVILGGIRRIGEVASVLVPFMCALYVLCGLWILLVHADRLAWGFAEIGRQAFAPDAAWGGFAGVLVQGFRRAAFSNEAGIGSAPIAHSTAATPEPVREGIVSLLEPFIDTVVVCNVTALVLVVTGAHEHPAAGSGIAMTSWAFATIRSFGLICRHVMASSRLSRSF